MSIKRLAPSAVLAVGVTCLIGLGMTTMIKSEFTPQEKSEKLTFEINPVPDDILPPEPRLEPEQVKRVETPPPPPRIEQVDATEPTVEIVSLDGGVPDFEMPEIDQEDFIITVSDGDPQPLVRIAPIMPPRAEKSGHCRVRFNVSAEGAPYDVVATYCTQSLFERATIKSVQRWKFKPKVVNGRNVAMVGLENKVTYQLSDERGRLIPELVAGRSLKRRLNRPVPKVVNSLPKRAKWCSRPAIIAWLTNMKRLSANSHKLWRSLITLPMNGR